MTKEEAKELKVGDEVIITGKGTGCTFGNVGKVGYITSYCRVHVPGGNNPESTDGNKRGWFYVTNDIEVYNPPVEDTEIIL